MVKGFKPGGIVNPSWRDGAITASFSGELYLSKKQKWELGKITGHKQPRKSTTLKGLVKRLRK